MNLNTHQLQCLLEIESTKSISQAAINLYMAQPNLSRILKETEKETGFSIFERTRNGVYPTDRGKLFLLRARSILNDTLFIEQLASKDTLMTNLRVCIPRSFHFSQRLVDYLAGLKGTLPRDLMVIEADPNTACEQLEAGKVDLILIRFLPGDQNYFVNRAKKHGFDLLALPDTQLQVVFRRDDPLAAQESVDLSALREKICFFYTSEKTPAQSMNLKNSLQISDRLAQLQLLGKVPNSFSWMEPLPTVLLNSFSLVQRPCSGTQIVCRNAMLFRPTQNQSEDFLRIQRQIYDDCSIPFIDTP